MRVTECCSTMFGDAQNLGLAFIPSFVLGLVISAGILFYFYQKQTKKPYLTILYDIISNLFWAFPSCHEAGLSGSVCNSQSCIRCNQYKQTKQLILERWDSFSGKYSSLKRLHNSIELIRRDGISSDPLSSQPIKLSDVNTTKKEEDERHKFQRPTLLYIEISSRPCWNEFEIFEIEKNLLKSNFSIILQEYQAILKNLQSGKPSGWKSNSILQGHWCIFPLIDQGHVIEPNCDQCPCTFQLLESLPALMKDSVFGNASFSLLYVDSHIEPHCGPTNLRLRCHFCLQIPGKCWLEVGGNRYHWKEGESIIFDDSFEHSAHFPDQKLSSEIPRAILMVDFWHPGITAEEKSVLVKLLKP